MVKLLTVAAVILFGNFTVMADPLSGAGYQRLPLKAGSVSGHLANKPASLRFQMTHDYVGNHWIVSKDLLQPRFASQMTEDVRPGELPGLRRYDAALSYPMVKKRMNLDLGLNIRFVNSNAVSYVAGTQQHNFSEAIPMFYAAALFDLPFKGLSAGFVGRHSDSLINPSFDYKAKLSYKWAGGLGLEGGWQHQQYANDGLNKLQGNSISKGLFLDLHLRF